jgi:threonine synthase
VRALPPSRLSHLECSACGKTESADALRNLCACGAPLLARYDLKGLRRPAPKSGAGMWRFAELLPHRGTCVSLGEGDTPIVELPRLRERLGIAAVFAKDESRNPNTSFKSRGLSTAVTMAKALGAQALALPTAGNAGGALAAYGARAGLAVHVFMPADTPEPFELECRLHGAEVTRLDALIDECGRIVREGAAQGRWFDVSTLKEPYRLEGKKTMGFEMAEQLADSMPDIVLYPTGGGTGLIGIWKAFEELRQLGWYEATSPRLIAVQAAGCMPIVRAFARGDERAERFEGANTLAYGLRVPSAVGDRLMLRALRESDGDAVAVSEAALLQGCLELAREGLPVGPESGALWAAAIELGRTDRLPPSTRLLLLSTGSGHKYVDALRAALRQRDDESAH